MSNRNGVWSLPAQYQAIADQDWTMAPGAPTGVSATAGNAQAEVSFTAPTFAGIPGTITQFKVTSSSGQTATGSASPITVTGLTNGSGVTFTAQAQNAIGLGKASDASSSVTPLAEVISGLFSCHLYTGTGSNQTITNGINLSGKGGMVWIKGRNATSDHALVDTVRGGSDSLASNTNAAERTDGAYGVTFNSNGFTSTGGNLNVNGREQVSWTFRKQPKFFDVVTWTGDGTSGRSISHSLNSSVGMIFVKRTDASEDWRVLHRNDGSTWKESTSISTDTLSTPSNGRFGNSSSFVAPTSTAFTVNTAINSNTDQYVAYLFAHNNNDGGFGPDSEDIIKCGNYTGNGNADGPVVNLGFEPQWLLVKRTENTDGWCMIDNMREWTADGTVSHMRANLSEAEASTTRVALTSTGFQLKTTDGEYNENGENFIYMAIRRPDMSTPTSASDVFAIDQQNASEPYLTSGFPVDFAFQKRKDNSSNWMTGSRLQGAKQLNLDLTSAEGNETAHKWDYMDGFRSDAYSSDWFGWMWKRARGYFDVVAYSGTGSNRTITHNLSAVPEMMWIKRRDATGFWSVYHKDLNGGSSPENYYLLLHDTNGETSGSTIFNDTAPTSSVFSVGTHNRVNNSSGTYVAYLFATVAGVSKVGTFNHNNSSSTNVDCGFSSGAKFVIIKQSDATSDWRMYDTTRGIVSGNDAYLNLNENTQENSGDFVDPLSSGFTVTDNYDTGTYIFYAIAA